MRNIIYVILLLLILSPAFAYAAPRTVDVSIDGVMTTINYDVEGIEILDIKADLDYKSLLIRVDVNGLTGLLTITFDRHFFDSVSNGVDEPFIVIAEGEEFEPVETITDKYRTLRIELPPGVEEIEIFGTHFGTDNAADTSIEELETESIITELPTIEPEVISLETTESIITELPTIEPEAKDPIMENMVKESKTSSTQCGAGTVLKNGVCVLDQTCGAGTILVDGVCVLNTSEKTSVSSAKDLIIGAGTALAIAFILMLFFWLISRGNKEK